VQGQDWLAVRFEENRDRLRGVAYRMLGSVSEADDAVQEAWLRLSRSDSDGIENLNAWLTTVVSRVCLDVLRSRKSRREESLETQAAPPVSHDERTDPEQEAMMADAVGLALLVVLDRLSPAERLAFVLHDLFAIPFEEIGGIVGKSPMAARQLASRARKRVQGATTMGREELDEQRDAVNRFLAALRAGDVNGLVAVLDPEFVIHIDEFSSVQPGASGQREVRGAENWARQAVAFTRMARFIRPMLVDGVPGIVLAPKGRLMRVLRFRFAEGKIVEAEVIGDQETLSRMELAVLETA
jgi:RNA polymerase sigma factor (sigma-70 family)